jgi:hypothetical protein
MPRPFQSLVPLLALFLLAFTPAPLSEEPSPHLMRAGSVTTSFSVGIRIVPQRKAASVQTTSADEKKAAKLATLAGPLTQPMR